VASAHEINNDDPTFRVVFNVSLIALSGQLFDRKLQARAIVVPTPLALAFFTLPDLLDDERR